MIVVLTFLFSSNPSLLAFLGENRSNMLAEFSTLTQKYGAQPGACETAFKATCPWDNAGITSIVMKLMVGTGDEYGDHDIFYYRQAREPAWQSWH